MKVVNLIFISLQVWTISSNAFPHDLNQGSNTFYKMFNEMDFGVDGEYASNSDDTNSLIKAWNAACMSKGAATVEVPKTKTYRVKSIQFDGTNCKFSSVNFRIKGKIVRSENNDMGDCQPYWLSFININGLTIDGNGLIDGKGLSYWKRKKRLTLTDENGESYQDENEELDVENGSDGCDKSPAGMEIDNCKNVVLNHVNSKDSPGIHIHMKNCVNVFISNVNIRAPGKSPNTDGINIRRTVNVTIRDSIIGTGDDCVAINDGSRLVKVSNIVCGPGHGISVGSLGKHRSHETVEDVYVKNCTFSGTTNGARIKTAQYGSGYARRITYRDIILKNAKNPIIIDQSYCPHKECKVMVDSAVEISKVSFIGIRGTSANENAIQLNCDSTVGCTDIVLRDIKIQSSDSRMPPKAICENAHGTQSKTSPSVSCLKRAKLVRFEDAMFQMLDN